MTLVEVAELLFVSHAHVKKLVESGKLNEVLPRNRCGTLNIDVDSVEKYKAELDAAKRAYLDSQTEDDDPRRGSLRVCSIPFNKYYFNDELIIVEMSCRLRPQYGKKEPCSYVESSPRYGMGSRIG